MQTNARLLRQVLAITALAIVGGTIGYRHIEEGWTLFDAFYMTIITLTTIGFGEVHELSPGGRAFTIVLVVFGLGAAAAFATQFARLLVEGDLRDYWRKRRMERLLSRLKGHVIVCGYGRIGRSICHELTEMGASCVVVESSEERQTEARDNHLIVLPGNATSDIALISAGVGRASAIVAALSHDTDNVFVALSARDLNPDLVIIARSEDRSLESRMLKAGVNRVVYPAQLGGGRIAHMVGEEIGLDVESVEFRRATDVLGYDLKIYRNVTREAQTLNEIEMTTGAVRSLALVRRDGTRHEDPPPDARVEEMEAVVLLMDTNSSTKSRDQKSSINKRNKGNLSMGVAQLDEEHQQILTLIRSLDTKRGHDDPRVVHEVLRDLAEYTQHHFRNEEAVFKASAYPHTEAHIAEHQALTEKVRCMTEDEAHVHPANLAALLEDWIVHHIQETDRGYVEYLNLELAR